MGNTTNPQRWDARQRLEFIEQAAYWRGWLQRSDLVNKFGLSLPQASADLQAYLDLNPASLVYDLKAKRYKAAEGMEAKLSTPDLSAAISNFLQGDSKAAMAPSDQYASIDLPFRAMPAEISKHLFRAVCQGLSVEIYYLSVNSGTEMWRWISPHAFAHDGYRWHVRAFCHRDCTYKDFVIGRIAEAKAPFKKQDQAKPDADWNTWEKLRLKAHRKLSPIQRKAVELDYEMHRGLVTMKVRRSMKNYTLAYLHLVADGNDFPQLLELADD